MKRTKIKLGIASSMMMVSQTYAGISQDALNNPIGLYQGSQFRISSGKCTDCQTIPQALWYFQNDIIAAPLNNLSGFDPTLRAQSDVKQWASLPPAAQASTPPLIWIGSPRVIDGQLADNGKTLITAEGTIPFSITPKIEANHAYFDTSSLKYFTDRQLHIRGAEKQNGFAARTIWPQDFVLNVNHPQVQPLQSDESLSALIRANNGGAESAFSTRLLWQRSPNTEIAGKPALSFVLNGAQGDDDEAHGGHFAVATGRIGHHGEWHDWLVNNFYNLGSVSEKGIIAATLPMDAYQADLNSGQSWYRPSYMLVVVLKNERSANHYQEAINRVFNHFYRQDFLYRHAGVNCAGINLETLRSVGWNIPKQGATNLAKAFIALPFKAIQDRSLESGMKAYEYLSAEQTNLYPFVAFEATGNDLLTRIVNNQGNTPYEKMLSEDIEAIIYVHIPQFPSSRAFGQAPVASLDEYMSRVPADHSQWKIIPVGARDFPATLKDAQSPKEVHRPAIDAIIAWLVVLLGILFSIVRFRTKYLKKQGNTI